MFERKSERLRMKAVLEDTKYLRELGGYLKIPRRGCESCQRKSPAG